MFDSYARRGTITAINVFLAAEGGTGAKELAKPTRRRTIVRVIATSSRSGSTVFLLLVTVPCISAATETPAMETLTRENDEDHAVAGLDIRP